MYEQTGLVAWQAKAIQELLALGTTVLVLRLPLAAPTPASRRPLGWSSYLRWGYRPAALRPAALPESWLRVPQLTYPSAELATKEIAASEMATNIRELHLDFMLSFCCIPPGELRWLVPRWGVWAFQLGSKGGRNSPVGFWEAYTGAPLTVATLVQMGGAAPTAVLRQGVFQTKRASPSRAADEIYAECAHWPTDACRQLQATGALAARPYPPLAPAAACPPPPNGAMLAFWGRLAGYKLRQLYEKFLVADQWNIGVVNRPIADFLQPASLQGVAIDAPPLPNRHVFYADCFARAEAAGPAVYFELYDYRRRRGHIARLPYPWPAGQAPTPVLRFPYHLSYPFLHGPYCLPEAWTTQSIRLYDLRQPALGPADGQVLLPVPGVDATLLEHAGRYWLFYTRADRDAMLNLFIAYADAPTGPWHEHPQNPVKTDIRSARPAGPFFVVAGRLYRPTQDCARDYGYALSIQEVTTLTTTDYAEREVAHLPSLHPAYPHGMHTLAALDATRTLIDFKRRRFIPMATLIAGWGVVSGLVYGKQGRRRPPAIGPAPAAGG